MATIKLDWQSIKIDADTSGWIAFKRAVANPDLIKQVCNPRTIYVIRICRPFSIYYENDFSCAAYICRGNFQKRITSYLKNWIKLLSKHIKYLKIEILVCLTRVQKNFDAYKDVEASLIDEFEKRFGSLPLRNQRRERSKRPHTFHKNEIAKAFGRGKGTGYHWAIWPVGSNPLHRN